MLVDSCLEVVLFTAPSQLHIQVMHDVIEGRQYSVFTLFSCLFIWHGGGVLCTSTCLDIHYVVESFFSYFYLDLKEFSTVILY